MAGRRAAAAQAAPAPTGGWFTPTTTVPDRPHSSSELSTNGAYVSVDAAAIRDRLTRGWSPDEAVGLVPHKRRPKRIKPTTCAGKDYPNIEVPADEYGLARRLVYARIRRGWSAEQAVGLEAPPPRLRDAYGNRRPQHLKAPTEVDGRILPGGKRGDFKLYLIRNEGNGRDYVGITANELWQRFNGHKHAAKMGAPGKLYNAMRRYGIAMFTIELIRADAVDYAELQRQETEEIALRNTIRGGYNTTLGGELGSSESIEVDGQRFASRGAAAAHFGVDERVFNIRLSRLGWIPEEAAGLVKRTKFARHKTKAGGHEFPSLKAAAEHFGIDYKLAHDRHVGKGSTVEQALGLAPPPSRPIKGMHVEAFGERFPSINAAARRLGVKGPSLRLWVVELGEEPERAIRLPQAVEARRSGRRAE